MASELSLALTVRAGLEPGTIKSLLPHVAEIVVVFACQDEDLYHRWLDYLIAVDTGGIPVNLTRLTPCSHPQLFSLDVADTFVVGQSFAGEQYRGPCTGKMFVADWAAARNLGLSLCSKKWRLVLCDNDIVENPHHLARHCETIEKIGGDLYCLPHKSKTLYRPRIVSDLPGIKFAGPACETIVGAAAPLYADSNSTDLWTSEIMSARRLDTFKVLYADARQSDWMIAPSSLLHLARTSLLPPSFAFQVLEMHQNVSQDPEMLSFASSLLGELAEAGGNLDAASAHYERSLDYRPNAKSALRLCNSAFRQSRWLECLNNYDLAVSLCHIPIQHDDGPLSIMFSLVYVAFSQKQLGHVVAARHNVNTLQLLFPSCQSLEHLRELLL